MITYIIYKVGLYAIKKSIKDNTNIFPENWRPGNINVGKIANIATNVILIII